MRVLAVGNMYPPHHFGGYELVWRSAMRRLEQAGHEVLVLTTDVRTETDEPDDANVRRDLRWYWRDHAFPALSVPERLRLERHNQRVLRAALDDFEPAVVTWWSMGGMSLSLVEQVRRDGVPAVAFVHDHWLAYAPQVDAWQRLFAGRRRRIGGVAERLTGIPTRIDLGAAARYVFVSEAMRKRADTTEVYVRDSGVAHSGIDPAFLDPAPERDWSWRLLCVGRLDERKGLGTAIEALAHLPEATLTVIGGADEAEGRRLRDRAAELGVAHRVRFEGQRTRDEVHAAYAEADAVLFPVIWEEPWGLVPLEAMARGRPVVATGRGGSGEYLVDGENALLFEPGDAAALAQTVRRLGEDGELRARLRAGGLETAPRHTESVFNEAVLVEVEACAFKAGGALEGVAPADARIVGKAMWHTMTGPARLVALVDAVRYCERRGIPGAFAECGVWRGGSVLAMILTLQELGSTDRDIYLFDTFEGMTAPTEHDVSALDPPALATWQEAEQRGERPWPELFDPGTFSEQGVRDTLLATGYPPERLHFVRGPVEETLPAAAPEQLALLRLDTDWYASTRHELEHLYPRLATGGVLIVDDYGHWDGARRAVDEYFDGAAEPVLLNRIDYTGRIAIKA